MGPRAVSASELYSSPDVVTEYVDADDLQPAEAAVKDLLAEQLAGARMLDIGVGGGRTTRHFVGLVGSYTGIDFSRAMIDACRERCRGAGGVASGASPRFALCDARELAFADGSFDFVLFSFNGIDELLPDERVRTLRELRRVCRPGGHVCFSSANIQSLTPQRVGLRRQLCRNPRVLGRNVAKWLRLRLIHNRHVNHRVLRAAPHIVMYDHVHNSLVRTHYVRPATQIDDLSSEFVDVRAFSLSGSRLEPSTLDDVDDQWLYYLATVPGGVGRVSPD